MDPPEEHTFLWPFNFGHRCFGVISLYFNIRNTLPKSSTFLLGHPVYNSILRLNYWPVTLKQAKVIMVPKPGKDPNEVSSYRPISLLPVLSKILEKLILLKLTNEPNSMNWIPWHQFGFRKSHSTIQQCHRLVDTINEALEDKNYCPALFSRRKPGFRQSLAQRPHAKNTTNTPNEILRHPPIIPKISLPNNYMQQ